VPDEYLPFLTRLWFAWLCFFKVIFDARFAQHVWSIHRVALAELPPAGADASDAAPRPPADSGGLQRLQAKALSAKALAAQPELPDGASALQLLSLLQREGRLVDFLQQDIASFADADVGAAARVVHEGCRKALRAHADIAPVRTEEEGARVRLEAGFDADMVKLVGEVRGEPPYAGVLRHRGWRAIKLELPRVVGSHDAHVLAPAEVELG
jgi:hypothetical protein